MRNLGFFFALAMTASMLHHRTPFLPRNLLSSLGSLPQNSPDMEILQQNIMLWDLVYHIIDVLIAVRCLWPFGFIDHTSMLQHLGGWLPLIAPNDLVILRHFLLVSTDRRSSLPSLETKAKTTDPSE